jgi:hypothetical protein
MAMISGGDESARNAFRAILRDDSSQLSIISTEEMSPGDVLEVKNLADAIERAERVMRESSRPRDMFAELGGAAPTDDASGPAVYAKPTLTPVPPAVASLMATPLPLPPAMTSALATQPLPIIYVPMELPDDERRSQPPNPASSPSNDEDAFLQPAGRMRHFAEETLDGYRPDTTMQVRSAGAGQRRKTFAVVVGVALGVLVAALGAGVIVACLPKAEMKPDTKPVAVVATTTAEAPKTVEPKKEETTSSVPTMNVNDLPTARSKR